MHNKINELKSQLVASQLENLQLTNQFCTLTRIIGFLRQKILLKNEQLRILDNLASNAREKVSDLINENNNLLIVVKDLTEQLAIQELATNTIYHELISTKCEIDHKNQLLKSMEYQIILKFENINPLN